MNLWYFPVKVFPQIVCYYVESLLSIVLKIIFGLYDTSANTRKIVKTYINRDRISAHTKTCSAVVLFFVHNEIIFFMFSSFCRSCLHHLTRTIHWLQLFFCYFFLLIAYITHIHIVCAWWIVINSASVVG